MKTSIEELRPFNFMTKTKLLQWSLIGVKEELLSLMEQIKQIGNEHAYIWSMGFAKHARILQWGKNNLCTNSAGEVVYPIHTHMHTEH